MKSTTPKLKQKNLTRILIAAVVVLVAVAAIVPLAVQGIQKQKIQKYFEGIQTAYPYHWDSQGLWYAPYKAADAPEEVEPSHFYVVDKKEVNTMEGVSLEVKQTTVPEGTQRISYEVFYSDNQFEYRQHSLVVEKKMYGTWCKVSHFIPWPESAPVLQEGGGSFSGSYPLESDPLVYSGYDADGELQSITYYPDGFTADPGEYRLVMEVYTAKFDKVKDRVEHIDPFYLAAEFTIVPAE